MREEHKGNCLQRHSRPHALPMKETHCAARATTPWTEARITPMRDVSFRCRGRQLLPRWMRVFEMARLVAGVHTRFDRAKRKGFLPGDLHPPPLAEVRKLSKGMVGPKLHLALVSWPIDRKAAGGSNDRRSASTFSTASRSTTRLLNDYFGPAGRTIVRHGTHICRAKRSRDVHHRLSSQPEARHSVIGLQGMRDC